MSQPLCSILIQRSSLFITSYLLLAQAAYKILSISTSRFQATTAIKLHYPVHLYHQVRLLLLLLLLHKAGDHSKSTGSLSIMWTFFLNLWLFNLAQWRNQPKFYPVFDCICKTGFGQLQTYSVYGESIFIDHPTIQNLWYPWKTSDSCIPPQLDQKLRTATRQKNLNSLFMQTRQPSLLWSGQTLVLRQNPTLRSTLVHKYVRHLDFKPEELRKFDSSRENHHIDALDASKELPLPELPLPDSFQKTSVDIEVPTGVKGAPPYIFSVIGLYYQKIIACIRSIFSSPIASHFHYSPFKQYHTCPTTGKQT